MSVQDPAWPAGAVKESAAGGLGERWRRLRDGLLASPRFQRWAAGFPLTRPVARRRAQVLFDICAGFVYSQVLFACVRLRLFEVLAAGPLTEQALAARLDLPLAGTARLLRGAASLGLVERRRGGRWGLGELGAATLGNPGIAAMVEHHTRFYADMADPVALLRGEREITALGDYWPYAHEADPGTLGAEEVADYSDLMAASQHFVADDILDAWSLKGFRRLLDVGGGDGTFITAVARRWPHLSFSLFDLPAVAERARLRLERAGLGHCADVQGGDVFTTPLPVGADVASLVRVLHDHDDDGAVAIIRAVRRVLPSHGALVVAEPMADTPGAEPMGEAYFGFYLMAMGSGRPRTAAELTALLKAGGFRRVRAVATRRPLLTRLLVARP